MGVITAASTPGNQGILKVFNFTTITNNDTFAGPPNPKAYWLMSRMSTVGANVSESSGTYTFYVGATGAGTLFVIL